MTPSRKRLEALEARQAVRVRGMRGRPSEALLQEAQRVCLALPEDLQDTVKAGGAQGYGALLEAWWEVDRGEGLAASALAAYRLAFEGEI